MWEKDPRSALLESYDSDQCIFLNYYKMKSRAWWRSTVMRAAAGDHIFPYDGNGDGTSEADLCGCSDEHDEVEKVSVLRKCVLLMFLILTVVLLELRSCRWPPRLYFKGQLV